MMKKQKYTDQQFIKTVESSQSISQVLSKLGLTISGGSYKLFHIKVKNFNLNTSHFTGQAYLKGKNHNWNPKNPIEDILINGSNYQTRKLKIRLIKEGFLENICAICGINSWNKKPIVSILSSYLLQV